MADDYQAGLSIAAVARRYGVNQETAAARLRKHGVEIRPPKSSIPTKKLEEARALHAAGWTYEALGRKYGCSGVAVRRTLLRTASGGTKAS